MNILSGGDSFGDLREEAFEAIEAYKSIPKTKRYQ